MRSLVMQVRGCGSFSRHGGIRMTSQFENTPWSYEDCQAKVECAEFGSCALSSLRSKRTNLIASPRSEDGNLLGHL
jgi:hypothetical protein